MKLCEIAILIALFVIVASDGVVSVTHKSVAEALYILYVVFFHKCIKCCFVNCMYIQDIVVSSLLQISPFITFMETYRLAATD